MKVLLIHPPGSYVDMPVLGIPCLKAYLQSKAKIDVDVWDSNVEFLEYLLKPETLRWQGQEIGKMELSESGQEWAAKSLFLLPYLEQHTQTASKTFRSSEEYYNVDRFNRAVSIVQEAVKFYSSPNEPFQFTYDSTGFFIREDRDRLPFSFEQLLQHVRDQTTPSVLYRFLRSAISTWADRGPYDVVGLTCPNPNQLLPSLILGKMFKEMGIARKTVLGGSFVTATRRIICSNPETYDFFDGVITFEGEEALFEYVQALEKGGNLKQVPNLSFRSSGEVIQNEPRKISDLSALPTPDFSGLPIKKYWTPEPVLPAYSTRGCFYDICTFCNHHENYFGTFRGRSVELVIQDLRTLQNKYGAKKIFFVDELMVPRQQVEIAEGIVKAGLKTRWYAHARVAHQLTRDRLQTLADGGLTLLHVGMESANTRVLELMKKGYDRPAVLKFLGDLRHVPLSVHLNTIRGYPGEQPEEYLETIETALEYAKVGDYVHLYGFGMISEAPITKGNQPYITSFKARSQHDLEQNLEYETEGVRTFSDEERERVRKTRMRLDQSLQRVREIFPKECCWAAHLLYVSHYREGNQSELLDTPLKDAKASSPKLGNILSTVSLDRLRVEPLRSLVLTKLPVDGLLKSFVFDSESFFLSEIPKEMAELIEKEGEGNTSEVTLPHLYQLVRVGAIRLKKKGEKRARS